MRFIGSVFLFFRCGYLFFVVDLKLSGVAVSFVFGKIYTNTERLPVRDIITVEGDVLKFYLLFIHGYDVIPSVPLVTSNT